MEDEFLPPVRTHKQRAELVDRTAERAEKAVDIPREWGIEESSLLVGEDAFNETFHGVIPEGYADIREYIESVLADKNGQAIGLELGGTASNLFGGFTPGFFLRSAGVSIKDNRDEIMPGLKAESEGRNHSVILGDMFDNGTKAKIVQDFLQGQKADVIFERAKLGQKYYPRDAHFIGKQLAFWYEHLADNGVMFLTPPFAVRDEYVEPWMEMIRESYAGQIEVQTEEGYNAIRIRKLSGAPEHLPLIDQRASFRKTLTPAVSIGRPVTKPHSAK